MKVREIITMKKWQDGRGYTYEGCVSDRTIYIESLPKEMTWSWWDIADESDTENGADIEITLKYYQADIDDVDSAVPLAQYSVWESDLIG